MSIDPASVALDRRKGAWPAMHHRRLAQSAAGRLGVLSRLVVRRSAEAWITKFAAWDLAPPTALLARTAVTTIKPARPQKSGKSERPRWRVLLLPRSRFTEDALSALERIDSLSISMLPRKTVKAIAAAFLPDEVDDNNYSSTSEEAHAAMREYRAFLKRFWQHFDPERKFDAVITGNFGYCAERELAAALEEAGVPFVALHKENMWSEGTQSFWEKVYRERKGPFLGRRILVYSPIQRDMQIRAGIADASRIEVVGMPRLDEVHEWRQGNIGLVPNPAVLFVSFHPDVRMPVLRPDSGFLQGRGEYVLLDERPAGSNLDSLCRSAHRAMVDLARAAPDITVLVKSKGRDRDRAILNELLGVADESELPRNLRVFMAGSPLPLLFQASVVCGLHSTLLLEALAAGRPVVVPWFDEVLDPAISRYVFDLGEAVTRVGSPEALIDKVRELALARTPVPAELPPETRHVLREWVGNEDGQAGERTAAAILRVLETGRG